MIPVLHVLRRIRPCSRESFFQPAAQLPVIASHLTGAAEQPDCNKAERFYLLKLFVKERKMVVTSTDSSFGGTAPASAQQEPTPGFDKSPTFQKLSKENQQKYLDPNTSAGEKVALEQKAHQASAATASSSPAPISTK
jgi:hypothetical protein